MPRNVYLVLVTPPNVQRQVFHILSMHMVTELGLFASSHFLSLVLKMGFPTVPPFLQVTATSRAHSDLSAPRRAQSLASSVSHVRPRFSPVPSAAVSAPVLRRG